MTDFLFECVQPYISATVYLDCKGYDPEGYSLIRAI